MKGIELMKAIVVEDDQTLAWKEVPAPALGPKEVAIAVKATAINRADLMQRRVLYPPPPGASIVLGLECAGIVSAVGDETVRFKVGDAVCALLPGGGMRSRWRSMRAALFLSQMVLILFRRLHCQKCTQPHG